jgi:cytochrome b
MGLIEYRVWDRTQRVFHWINVLAILALAGIGTAILNADALGIPDDPGMIALKTVHVYVGYVFILNLSWRFIWLFVGGPFARWGALLPVGARFGARLVQQVRGTLSNDAPFYVGHNPLARIVLTLIVLLMAVQGATGLVLAGTDVYLPPFGGSMREWVAADTHDAALVRPYAPDSVNATAYAEMRAFRSPIVRTHEYTFFVLLALIALHVVAAVVAEVKEGGTIISAMFTGRKISARVPVDVSRDP